MAVYPDVITYVRSRAPLSLTLDSRTLITKFEGEGQEKRRQKWTVKRRRVELEYVFMTQDETRVLLQFWEDRKGAFEAFTFFYPNVDTYAKEFVGTASVGAAVLRLPARSLTVGEPFILYRNGIVEDLGDYAVVDHIGPDGEAVATLINPAVEGDRFDFSFTGELGMRMRFETNSMELEIMKAHGSWSIALQEIVRDTL
jgi:hypothetical protein